MAMFVHDCAACQFIELMDIEGTTCDIYRCPGGSLGPSWIARFGDEGSEYWSMPEDVLLGVVPGEGTVLLQSMQLVAKEWNKRNAQL